VKDADGTGLLWAALGTLGLFGSVAILFIPQLWAFLHWLES
jgi:hypothetical protein